MKKTFTCAPNDCQQERTLGAGLASFANRYQLSARKLSAACGGSSAGVSKSSADRICRGVAELRVLEHTRLAIMQNLTHFLSSLGKTDEQIEVELQSIFSSKEVSTMIAARTPLPFDTQKFFNLRCDPFNPREPREIAEAFVSAPLDAIAERVTDAINYQGFMAVIGEIGSGKTILKRRIIDATKDSQGKLRLLWPEFAETERVSPGAIVHFILEALGQKPRQRLVASQQQLKALLANFYDQGIRVALGFDECHHLNDTTLIALKNFYELGTGGYDKYIGVILFGQPRFYNRMYDASFREIAERLEIVEMPELGKQAWDYLTHRFRLAGGDADKLFEKKAVERLAVQAPTPLALGNLLNAALIKAHKLGERKVLSAFIQTPGDEPKVRAVRRVS